MQHSDETAGDAAIDRGAIDDTEISALEALTRMLVGIAWNSAHAAPEGVSFPQMRMLLVLASMGKVPSSRLARALGANASSVTRLGDRLEAQGYLARERDPANRSVVLVEVTTAGHAAVTRVLELRAAAFTLLLDRLPPRQRARAVAAVQDLVRVGADAGEPVVATIGMV